MNIQETALLLKLMQRSFPNYKLTDEIETAKVWAMMLADDDYPTILEALREYIRDEHEYAPSIGQLLSIAREMTTDPREGAGVAWAKVLNALRNSIYNSQAEFDNLPPLAQQVMGSASELRRIAMTENINLEVEKSLFERKYNALLERETKKDVLHPISNNLLENRERELLPFEDEL